MFINLLFKKKYIIFQTYKTYNKYNYLYFIFFKSNNQTAVRLLSIFLLKD
jgi:hypothetical protein